MKAKHSSSQKEPMTLPGGQKFTLPRQTGTTFPNAPITVPGKEEGAKNSQDTLAIALKTLKFALFATIGFVAWLNIKPYINAVEFILYGDGQTGIVLWLSALPVIGSLVALMKGIGSFILGTLIWAAIQICEVLPTLLKTSTILKQVINGLGKHRKLTPRQGAGAAERRLTKMHNDRPQRWVRHLYLITVIVYVLDFLIVFITYPPISGGIEGLRLWLAAPNFGAVDYWNLAQMMIVLFAFEAIVFLFVFLWEAADMGIDPRRKEATS